MRPFLFSREAADEAQFFLQEVGLEASSGDPMAKYRGGQLSISGGIATVDISGALVNDTSLFGQFIASVFGGTLTPELNANLETVKKDDSIRGVFLEINSPGGEVAGTERAAQLVREIAAIKPVIAHVSGLAASGAYWIASAATKIVADGKTVQVGSIGTVAVVKDSTERDTRAGIKTIQVVSSQSPKKRPDFNTEAGIAILQEWVDALAAVFVEAVAVNRGVAESKVLAEFGQGDILLAEKALGVGMIDAIGSQEIAMSTLRGLTRSEKFGAHAAANSTERNPTMEQPTIDVAAERAAAVKADRERMAAIKALGEAKGRESLAEHLALNTNMSVEEARGVLAASPIAGAVVSPLTAAMSLIPNPDVKPGDFAAGTNQTDVDAEVKRILAVSGELKEVK